MKTLKLLTVFIAWFYHLQSYSELFNMKLEAYLFTINKNNSYRLDPDELKDVQQDIKLYLSQKSYNNYLVKKTCLSFYKMAIGKKVKQETLVSSGAYLENFSDEEAIDLEAERRSKVRKLKLSDVQKKIMDLLISGYEYTEVRKKLRINQKQLLNHVYQIRVQNCVR